MASVILFFDENPEVTKAWQSAAGADDTVYSGDTAKEIASLFRQAYADREDVYLITRPTFPEKTSQFADYRLPRPSADRILKAPEGDHFINPASLYQQMDVKDHAVYSRGFPMSRRFRPVKRRQTVSRNTDDVKAGIFMWPTTDPDVDAVAKIVFPHIKCTGVFMDSDEAQGAILEPGAYMPMGGTLLVSWAAIPYFPAHALSRYEPWRGELLADVLAAYVCQRGCHDNGLAVGIGKQPLQSAADTRHVCDQARAEISRDFREEVEILYDDLTGNGAKADTLIRDWQRAAELSVAAPEA